MRKIIIVGVSLAALVAVIIWAYLESSKPLPGELTQDQGRDHVTVGTEVEYKTNPPTSGKHYPDWIRAGIYQDPQDDRYLVHSLEHGYVILSYNCDFGLKTEDSKLKNTDAVYAHGIGEEESTTSASEATRSAGLPTIFKSEECHKLVDELIKLYEKKGKKKLIIIPRPNMDAKIALTAWLRLDKLDEFDQRRIERFIDAHLNQGPEKTME